MVGPELRRRARLGAVVAVVMALVSATALGSPLLAEPKDIVSDDAGGLSQPMSIVSGDEDYALTFTRGTTVAVSPSMTAGAALTDGFTIEAWVKPSGCASGDHTVVSREVQYVLSCRSGFWQYALGNGSGFFALTGGDAWHSTGVAVDAGAWHHVALTRTSASAPLEFYYDGVLVNTRSPYNAALGAHASRELYIGDRIGGGHGFNGAIDEVRLWSVGRGADVATDMHTHGPMNATGLVAYYDFNEGPAGTTGSGTVYNRVAGASSDSNLRTVGGPTYVDIAATSTAGSTTTVTFPRSYLTAAGGWRVPESATSINVAVVGGGGAGGWNSGGGGGGGGASQDAITGAGGIIRRVTVGQGGFALAWPGGTTQGSIDAVYAATPALGAGQSSRFGDTAASGGAVGLSRGWHNFDVRSGGVGGTGTSNSGGVGGGAPGSSASGAGGGVGFSLLSPFSGDYSGGGGGGAGWSGGVGGSAGNSAAGAGGGQGANGISAPANLGGGGGGGGGYGTGGNGGSGVVIVSYTTTAPAPGSCSPAESTYTDGGSAYRVYRFTATGSCGWTVPDDVTTIDYLIVGGGGGGGFGSGGGGGGGGTVTATATGLTPGDTMTVVVGSGGSGGTTAMVPDRRGRNGGSSSLDGAGLTSVTALGGGGGGTWSDDFRSGRNGGAGGGAAWSQYSGSGAVGVGSQGDDGGIGGGSASVITGGGGGGAAAGGTGSVSGGGTGGAGVITSITGSPLSFAGGGGGGSFGAPGGAGGSGGGGAGGRDTVVGQSGTAGTGGGGGGGGGSNGGAGGGNGGSGIVIIRVPLGGSVPCEPDQYSYTDVAGSFTVLEFTSTQSCSWTPPAGVTEVDALLVAGGGAGGGGIGGGGGGGEVVTLSDRSVSGAQTITVGAGGVGVAGVGNDGGDTTALGVTVNGGGGGGWLRSGATAGAVGRSGGSGGGGACYTHTTAGSAQLTGGGSGSNGGVGSAGSVGACVAGGGGGAGGLGGAANGTSQSGGSGGNGVPSSITGSAVTYGGGGGGGINGAAPSAGSPGVGGAGGGGAGGLKATPRAGRPGSDGLGGGGGGGSNTDDGTNSVTGGDGGDGVVVIRYETNWLSLGHGSGQQPGDYRYSPSTADWVAAPKVQLIAAGGTTLSTTGVTVTASFTASTGSATLTNATATTDANGVAVFSSLVLNGNAGTAGTLTFSATGYGPVTSSTVTILKASPTLSWSALSKTFGDADFTLGAPSSSQAGSFTYASSNTAVISLNGATATVAGAGTATITATFTPTDTTNYSSGTVTQVITVAKAAQAALTVTSTSGTYGTSLTMAASGGSTSETVTFAVTDGTADGCTITAGALTASTAGTCSVTATRPGGANYESVSSSATTVTLGKATVTISGVTAANKQFDGTRAATLDFSTATLSGVVSGDGTDEVRIDSSSANGTFAASTVGTDVAVAVTGVSLAGSKATSSYTLAAQPSGVTADITSGSRTLAFGVTSHEKTYGDAAFTVTASPSVGAGTITYSATGAACSVATATGLVTVTAVGTCSISASITDDGSYAAASTTTPVTVTVGAATLTVTASSPSVTYGDPAPSVTPLYSGFVNGDTSAVVTTAPTCSTTYTATTSVLASPTTSCTGGAATNYTLVFVGGLVSVGQATVAVTASSPSVTYGDPVPSVTPSYSGFVNGDSSSAVTTAPSCSTTYTATSAVGSTPSTTCSGAIATNYSFTYTPGTVTIARATPTFAWSSASAMFGDGTVAITAPTPSTAGSFTYASSDTSVLSISGSSMTITGAGSATITATFTPTDTTNFVPNGTVTRTVTVAKGPQAALALTSTSGTYGTPVALATSGGTTGGPVSYTVADGTANGCVESAGSLSVTSAGTCTVTATMAGDDDHTPVSAPATTVTFAKAPQTITFADPAPSGATYGDPPIPVAPTASSGLDVTLVASDPTVCTVSGGGIDIVRAGSCTITASRAESQNHLAAADVVRTFTIAKANQAALSMTSASTAVFGERISLASSGGSGNGTVSYGVVSGTCTITSGSTLVLGDAGSLCEVAATKQTDANHLAITSATQTITIARAGQTLAFTSAVPISPVSGDTYTPTAESLSTVTGRGSGVQPVFSVSGTCGLSGGVVTFVASGDCTITASATATTNFTAATDVSQTIAVGSINQNITFARPSDVAFGSSSVALEATASSGLTVTYASGANTTNSACSVSSLGVVSVLAVGTCEVTASQVGDAQFAPASDVTRTFLITPAVATAPTLASASAGSQSITVAFTDPGFTGGVPITAFEVTATPTGAGSTVVDTACTASPCTIGGLVNGVDYTVTVAAINAAGTGAASSATGPLTPVTAAFAVDAFSAMPGDTVVDLEWAALTTPQLGGGSFTRYKISIRPAGVTPTPAWTLVTDTLTSQTTDTFQVSGLDNGTSYEFRLVAFTTANTTEIPGNTALVVQYPATVPSAPRNPSVLAATATDVEFSWEVPLSDGGEVITGYTATVTSTSPGATTPISCSVTGVAPRCTASNLTNGAVYTFDVEAVNRMSTGSNGNTATATYNVPSSDATLASLVVTGEGSPIVLTPTFDPATTTYTAAVSNTVSAVTISATPTKAASTLRIAGTPVTNGAASAPIPLAVGENTIIVDVTASDPRFTVQYALTLTRAEPPVVTVSNPPATGDVDDRPAVVPVELVGADRQPFTAGAASSGMAEMLAAYVDRDGAVRVAPHTVVGANGPGPSLVVGSADDLMLTLSGREDGATSYDPVTGRVVIVAGRTVEVTGSGYYPGTEVEVWLFSDPVLLGRGDVASDGTWVLATRVPADIVPGDHHVQAEGMAGDGYERMVRASVVIESPLEALTLPESGSDLRLLEYAIVLAALGALAALVSTSRSRRVVV